MKQKGNQFLVEKHAEKKEESKEVNEIQQCTFCQEALDIEGFSQDPHGNFIYTQTSKLLMYSIK